MGADSGKPTKEKNTTQKKRITVQIDNDRLIPDAFDSTDTDNELVERVAMAYEITAIDGLDALLYPSLYEEYVQLRMQSYSLQRTLPIPQNPDDRIFHVLHLAALAYCSGQWTDLQLWLKYHEQTIKPPSVANANWYQRLLYRLYDCWLLLLHKHGWDDLAAVKEIIAGLRQDQGQYEKEYLDEFDNPVVKAEALRLIALYHWAKATELLADYMMLGQQIGIEAELDKHFDAGRSAASAAQDTTIEEILRWLHATSRQIVKMAQTLA